MTTFTNGPAKGRHLMLKRTPIFLRVTEAGGKWDALNEPEDTPLPEEKLHAYRLAGMPGQCHVNISGGRGGFFALAEYELVAIQPDDATMRDAAAWSRWCHSQPVPENLKP
jgi:hypothetical protein